MICKSDQIRAAWGAGDRIGALRIAARFFDRSSDTKTFKRGMDAYNNPRVLSATWEGSRTTDGSRLGVIG